MSGQYTQIRQKMQTRNTHVENLSTFPRRKTRIVSKTNVVVCVSFSVVKRTPLFNVEQSLLAMATQQSSKLGLKRKTEDAITISELFMQKENETAIGLHVYQKGAPNASTAHVIGVRHRSDPITFLDPYFVVAFFFLHRLMSLIKCASINFQPPVYEGFWWLAITCSQL